MKDALTFGGWLKRRRSGLGLTQKELARQIGYAEVTLRKVEAGEVRPSRHMAEVLADLLQIPAGDREHFVLFAREEAEGIGDPPLPKLMAPTPAKTKVDWGEAPDTSRVLGRQRELEQLRQWLVSDRCKVVAVLGMGGAGKTALATLTAGRVQEEFSAVIWRSLRDAPPLSELLSQCIELLSNHAEVELPLAAGERAALLIKYLREQRCLLVLDNFETVLQGDRPGHYLPGYEGYGILLKQIGEGRHQSCLLLTSREKPKELIPLAGAAAAVRALELASLDPIDSRVLLQDRGLHGSEREWGALHERFSGNPLALQIVAETIYELFGGNITQFLVQDTTLFGEINDLLTKQLTRLSALEQDVLFWLAINREPVTAEELCQDLVPRPRQAAVLAALHALRQRFLVERVQNGFTLQNVVLEYFTSRLVDQVCGEIKNSNAVLLQCYALLKASAKRYVRESQRSLILGPIVDHLLDDVGLAGLIDRLNVILVQLRSVQPHDRGYAGGNILNLLVQLRFDLRGMDFSQLCVWQADLRNINAQDMDLDKADLLQSAFTDTLAGVIAITSSPDGERLAAATMRNQIHMWRASDGKPLITWAAHQGWVKCICFSPDNSLLASGGGDGVVRLWNPDEGKHLTSLHGHAADIISVSFSPDGSFLASGSYDRTVRLWDTTTGECLHVMAGHADWMWCVCFSPDGRFLASGSLDHTIRLWDPNSGECLRVLQGHTNYVNSVCFSPDSSTVVSASNDATLRMWDPNSGECRRVLQGHTNHVNSACFCPDGSVLASAGYDRTIRLWDPNSGECRRVLQGHTDIIWSVCFSAGGNVLASGGEDQTVRLWDVHSGKCLQVLQGYMNNVNSVCFSPDGSILASGSIDPTVRLWDGRTGDGLRQLRGNNSCLWAVCFSPDGNTLACGCGDHTVRLWDAHNGESIRVIQGHTNDVKSVCFSPDGNILASGSEDNTVRLWNLQNGECLRVLHSNSKVQSVCFTPDGSVLATGSDDHIVRLWNPQSGECLRELRGHTGWVWSVCFSPGGNILASASADHMVRLWDPRSGKCVRILQGHTGWLWSVCFSADENVLASGSGDQTVRLWSSQSGECLRVLEGHTNAVSSVCFSPDGTVLASASFDETIRLWDTKTSLCLRVLRTDRPYERMNIMGATGLTPAQVAALKRLGAVDE
jgi:WD40 repeat protein/transcriptional regulator with XRE-family HTH domain